MVGMTPNKKASDADKKGEREKDVCVERSAVMAKHLEEEAQVESTFESQKRDGTD